MRSLRRSLRRSSLRWRIALWSAAVMVLCLALAFVAVYRGTGSHLRGQIDAQVSSDVRGLSGALTVGGAEQPSKLAAAAKGYVSSRPFSASSTLLFANIPGVGTISNRPELFHADPPDNGETAAVQSSEDRRSAGIVTAPAGYSTRQLPDVGKIRLLERHISLPSDGREGLVVTVGAGEPLEPVADAVDGVARAFLLGGALALLAALIGGYLVASLASRSLRRIAMLAGRVDAGDLHPRVHGTDELPAEVRVLGDAFNHMLDRLSAAFAAQRDFVADASHELRTPLTVIRGQIELLCDADRPSPEELRRVESLLGAEVVRMDRLIDDLLLLAELEQDDFLQAGPVELSAFVEELWGSTMLLAERRFQVSSVPAGSVTADPDRLAQALRNLLTNAIKHTTAPDGRVELTVESGSPGHISFAVEDDGPGIPPEQRERVFERFHRTDPSRDRASGGAGLGLAIVRAIAEAHGGSVQAEESRYGGARLVLTLPGFVAEPEAPVGAPARGAVA